MKYRTVLLFGAPGAGKGTQGRILGHIPNFFYCACGDVFRNLTIEHELGRIFIEYSSRGQLVPDEITIRLWREFIDSNLQTKVFNPERDILVLDGIPRNRHQAEMLQDALDVKAIFRLTCLDKNKLVERLQRRALRENRLDDVNLDVIRSRLETYERETKPVLDFYGAGLVHNIDSTQSPVVVLKEVTEVLAKL